MAWSCGFASEVVIRRSLTQNAQQAATDCFVCTSVFEFCCICTKSVFFEHIITVVKSKAEDGNENSVGSVQILRDGR